MRDFNYTQRCEKLLTPKIVLMLNRIEEYKGRHVPRFETTLHLAMGLKEIALIHSTEASNRIEGIFTSDHRLRAIVTRKAEPLNRSEAEIAGYRDVLSLIQSNVEAIPFTTGTLHQLHRDLFRYTGSALGGKTKATDNTIEAIDETGQRSIRFQPVSAFETPQALEAMMSAYTKAKENELNPPLILIALVILDFLCIHPYSDGNGRMSRLLTLLLMGQSGYQAGQYLSLEKQIEDTKESYYEALHHSSHHWHEGLNDDGAFVEYALGVWVSLYSDLDERLQLFSQTKLPKPQRIKQQLLKTLGEITKRELKDMNPDISETTLEVVLSTLVKEGFLAKVSGGRYTSYVVKN